MPVGNGNQKVRISWTEGGFLGLFEDNPTVTKSKSIVVDFTYRALASSASTSTVASSASAP